MAVAAIVFGILGGASAVLGGLIAGGVAPLLKPMLTSNFFFIMAGILLLVCIAFNTGRSKGEY
ncbi:MAG: hypothetical protein J7K77_01860 [Dehalococcoidales bacterium]|nr:hypothetical protein [Dehalococcoidales bacterium]